MKNKTCILLAFLSLGWLGVAAQDFENNYEEYRYHIKKAKGEIRIDGLIEEQDWKEAQVATDFRRILPIDSGTAETVTEAMLTWDDQNLYITIVCYEELGPVVVESMRRDWSFGKNDNFLVNIDPFNDKTNGFAFGCNAAGAQWEIMLINGGSGSHWDNAWYSATEQYEDRWVTEMAIPFKILRYNSNVESWGINFSRLDKKRNHEKSSWAPVPRQFPSVSLAFTGALVWDQPPPKTGTNISLIPYAIGGVTSDKENGVPPDFTGNAGLDAKVSVTQSINLDLTINPDFSHVEVDRQVLNLDRFEIWYPERRQFFLENADLFSGYGNARMRPFFSRRIGLDAPILAGARFSGKLNKNWRAGLLNMQTRKKELNDSTLTPTANYSVATVQRQVFKRSNISAIFVNKQHPGYTTPDTTTFGPGFNRVAGIDYNIASEDNNLLGKIAYHRSFSPENNDKAFAHTVNMAYKAQTFSAEWNHDWIGENYNAQVGYVPRPGIIRFYPSLAYRFYPKNAGSIVNWHGPSIEGEMLLTNKSTLILNNKTVTDRSSRLLYHVWLLNTSQFTFGLGNAYTLLTFDFDPTNTGGLELLSGTSYENFGFGGGFSSDNRKLFTYMISSKFGQYFNGTNFNMEGSMVYRFQPYGSVSLNVDYNDIKLPDPYNDAKLLLIGPKLDFTFTDKLFWYTFVQYNNQIDNFNINTRFQWRFAPVSDLFIVYSDNYFVPDFMFDNTVYFSSVSQRNRALFVKITYWLNL